jgi:hypothetical protein
MHRESDESQRTMLSEESQTQKAIYSAILLYNILETSEMEKRLVVARD